MMDKELDGYLVLIFFILKQEKSLPSNKSKKERVACGIHNKLLHEL